MVFVTNKVSLHIPALYPIRTMAMAILTFSVSYLVGGNGLISVYIAALILGNSRFEHKKTQIQFFDGIAWLMQIIMFITLGLLVFPSQIVPVIGVGLIISFFLILVARPLAVVLCLLPFKVPAKDQIFISLVGIRGAVPIILATFPIAAGLNSANMIFNIVFFVTITSALLQGSTVNVLADYLGLSGSKNDE
ncbi:MAG TPA: cation:proton antiporter, partial [Methanobacterium sp.]|nr:cation:proton antiporter [Methanobacterium sp.]